MIIAWKVVEDVVMTTALVSALYMLYERTLEPPFEAGADQDRVIWLEVATPDGARGAEATAAGTTETAVDDADSPTAVTAVT